MRSIRWNIFLTALIAVLLFAAYMQRAVGQGYDMKFTIADSLRPGDTVILAYYFDDGRYISDSAFVAPDKSVRFKGEKPLPQGMYLVIFPNRLYFDILIGEEQKFSVESPSYDISNKKTKIRGSSFLEDFLELQRMFSETQEKYMAVRRLDSLARTQNLEKFTESKHYKEARKQQAKIGEDIDNFMNALQKKHGDDLLGKFALSTQEVSVPDPPAEVLAAKNSDSAAWMWSYYYFSQHYLDNIDLSFAPLLRTPTFLPKLHTYLDKRILQIPDTINKYCDLLLERAEKSDEVFRFLVSHLFTKYQTSDIMGMDAVLVHLAEKYFLAGKTPWVAASSIEKIRERVEELKPNLIGKKAPDFTVTTILNRPFTLHSLAGKAKATILVFWEPSCSHCKVALPIVDSTFRAYKDRGVSIIGFMTQGDGPAWQKYIEDHNLAGWFHVWDPYRKSQFHKLYNIYSTPVIYLLDEDLTIVAKRIGAEQLAPILDEFLPQQNRKK